MRRPEARRGFAWQEDALRRVRDSRGLTEEPHQRAHRSSGPLQVARPLPSLRRARVAQAEGGVRLLRVPGGQAAEVQLVCQGQAQADHRDGPPEVGCGPARARCRALPARLRRCACCDPACRSRAQAPSPHAAAGEEWVPREHRRPEEDGVNVSYRRARGDTTLPGARRRAFVVPAGLVTMLSRTALCRSRLWELCRQPDGWRRMRVYRGHRVKRLWLAALLAGAWGFAA